MGQTQFGVYRDECDGVHLDTINRYYGVHGKPLTRQGHQSGAGHPTDEEASGDEDNALTAQIAEFVNGQQQAHANQDAVHVPYHRTPFAHSEDEEAFFGMLYEMINHAAIPNGFGLTPAECETGDYPVFETIRLGRRRSKQLDVSLADKIWYERACLWCQALVCLMHFMNDAVS